MSADDRQADLGPVIGSIDPQPMIWRAIPDLDPPARWPLIAFFLVALWAAVMAAWACFVFTATPVHALTISCEEIREKAKGVPDDVIARIIKAQGLTKEEEAKVWACLKDRKK